MVPSLFPVEPTLTLDLNAHELLHCRAGTLLHIPVSVSGRPIPNLTWTYDGPAETEKKNERHTLPLDAEVNKTGTTRGAFRACSRDGHYSCI